MSILPKPYFHDEEAAFAHLESQLWPNGPVCPHCGGMDRISKIKANPSKRVRYGLHKCGDCKGQFTVKMGTVFEHARIPLHKMLQAVHLLCSSKKGISAHQLHRILEVQYKTAWFLAHRIREAMRDGSLAPLGGGGKAVEADETFIGHLAGGPSRITAARAAALSPTKTRFSRWSSAAALPLRSTWRARGRSLGVSLNAVRLSTSMKPWRFDLLG